MEQDESEDPVFSVAELVAIASGDERIMEYVEVEAAWQLSKSLLASYQTEVNNMTYYTRTSDPNFCIPAIQQDIQSVIQEIDRHEEIRAEVSRVLPAIVNQLYLQPEGVDGGLTGEELIITINGQVFTSGKEAAEYLYELDEAILAQIQTQEYSTGTKLTKVGTFGGWRLQLQSRSGTYGRLHVIGETFFIEQAGLSNKSTFFRDLIERLAFYLKPNQRHLKQLEDLQHKLAQTHAEIATKQQMIAETVQTISTQFQRKVELEAELGIQSHEDEMALIDCGESDD